MAEIPASNVVSVTIRTTPLAPSRAGFSTLLFVTTEAGIPFYEGVRSYASLADVADDWNATDEVYKAALAYFGQSPKPTSFKVGRRFADAQAAILIGGGNADDTIATWTAITTGAFAMSMDGESQQITGLNFSAATDMDDVADVIEAGLQAESGSAFTGATCEWDGTKFVITSGSAGATSTISVTSTPSSGTDISALMDNDAGNGTPFAGIDAETAMADCLDRLQNADSDWYFIACIKTIRDNADAEAVAAWAEANVKQYFMATNDLTTLSAATSSDISSTLNALTYRRTLVVFSSYNAQYPDAAAAGIPATVNFSAENATITMKFKPVAGITAETITSAQLAILIGKGCNVYTTIGGVSMFTEGIMVSGVGVFQDTVHGVDWLQNAIENNVFSYLRSAATKVPLTEEGAAGVEAQIIKGLDEGVRNGLIAPGYNLAGDKYYQSGYETAVGSIADMSITDRQQRKCPPISFIAIGAGAIHSAEITGNFEA